MPPQRDSQFSVIAQLKTELDQLREHYQDNTDVRVMPKDWQKKYRPAGL